MLQNTPYCEAIPKEHPAGSAAGLLLPDWSWLRRAHGERRLGAGSLRIPLGE